MSENLKVREDKNEVANKTVVAKDEEKVTPAAGIPVEAADNSAPAAAKPVKEITVSEDEEKIDNVIELSTCYRFEGETIDKIDLTGIEDLNAATMQKAEQIYRKITKNVSTTPELTLDYALAIAHILTGYPLEFLKQMNGKDATKIKMCVINFLYGEA